MCEKLTKYSCGHLSRKTATCRKLAARERSSYRHILDIFCPIPRPCTQLIKELNGRHYICHRCESNVEKKPGEGRSMPLEEWSNINLHDDGQVKSQGETCAMSFERPTIRGGSNRFNQQQETVQYSLPDDGRNKPQRRLRDDHLRRHNRPADKDLRHRDNMNTNELRKEFSAQGSRGYPPQRTRQRAGPSFSQRMQQTSRSPVAQSQFRDCISQDQRSAQVLGPPSQAPSSFQAPQSPANLGSSNHTYDHSNLMPAPLNITRSQARDLTKRRAPRPSRTEQVSPLISAHSFVKTYGDHTPTPLAPERLMSPEISGRYVAAHQSARRGASLGSSRPNGTQRPAEQQRGESNPRSGGIWSLHGHFNNAIRTLREQKSAESFTCQWASCVEGTTPRNHRRLA